jgi:hypothetical protein
LIELPLANLKRLLGRDRLQCEDHMATVTSSSTPHCTGCQQVGQADPNDGASDGGVTGGSPVTRRRHPYRTAPTAIRKSSLSV